MESDLSKIVSGEIREEAAPPVELDTSHHPLCALSSALFLIAGRPIYPSKHAYPSRAPSRVARLMQVGCGFAGLLGATGKGRTLVSGKRLAYRDGELEYFTGNLFRRWRGLGSAIQPFFVVNNADPAGSIAETMGCDREPAPRIFISRHQCTVVIMANRGGTPVVMHYAACDDSIAELERTAQGLQLACSDAWIRRVCATLLDHHILANGAAVLAQTRIPADQYEFSWRRVDTAIEFWSSYPRASGNGKNASMDARLGLACSYFSGFRDALLPVADALREWCDEAKIQSGLVHGDFWLGNVLFKKERVAGIIDWEWARRDGIPVADILHMLLRTPAMARDTSFAETLRRFWTDDLNDSELSSRLQQLCAQAGMGLEDLKFLAIVLWFDILWQRATRGVVESRAWLEDMIPHTATVALQWLRRHSKTGVF
jgi:hypothetical protein